MVQNVYTDTERNNPVNLQCERFSNLREEFMCTANDFKCMLLSIIVQDVESTVQHIKIKDNSLNVTAFSY